MGWADACSVTLGRGIVFLERFGFRQHMLIGCPGSPLPPGAADCAFACAPLTDGIGAKFARWCVVYRSERMEARDFRAFPTTSLQRWPQFLQQQTYFLTVGHDGIEPSLSDCARSRPTIL